MTRPKKFKLIDVKRILDEKGLKLMIRKNKSFCEPELFNLSQSVMMKGYFFVECKKGHRFTVRGDRLNKAKCLVCYPHIPNKFGIVDLKYEGSKVGLTCLSEDFLGVKRKYKFRCENGHVFEKLASTLIYQKSGCLLCTRKKQGEARRK